jgi:hypothetical protein
VTGGSQVVDLHDTTVPRDPEEPTFHQDVIAWFESVDLDQCCRDASVFLETKEKNRLSRISWEPIKI